MFYSTVSSIRLCSANDNDDNGDDNDDDGFDVDMCVFNEKINCSFLAINSHTAWNFLPLNLVDWVDISIRVSSSSSSLARKFMFNESFNETFHVPKL